MILFSAGSWNRGAIMGLLQRETQRSARIGELLGGGRP
jgi:hypothetical protein